MAPDYITIQLNNIYIWVIMILLKEYEILDGHNMNM